MTSRMPAWGDANLRRHFRDHGHQVGCSTIEEYIAASQALVRGGRQFTFRNQKGERRIGFFNPANGHFVVVSRNGRVLISFYRTDEAYCRRQDESTY